MEEWTIAELQKLMSAGALTSRELVRMYLERIELIDRHEPKAAFVYSTCIVGIIGDDLGTVCRKAAEELGIPVLPVKSEGFRGNKNEGYKAACNALFELIGTGDYTPGSRYSINLLGEYNVAGDVWSVKPFFEEMGIEVVRDMRFSEDAGEFLGTLLVSGLSSRAQEGPRRGFRALATPSGGKIILSYVALTSCAVSGVPS